MDKMSMLMELEDQANRIEDGIYELKAEMLDTEDTWEIASIARRIESAHKQLVVVEEKMEQLHQEIASDRDRFGNRHLG